MHLKKMYTLLIILLLLIEGKKMFAQDFGIGLGLTLEHPQEINYERMSRNLKIHKVYLPITVISKIRAIPEIAYWNAKYSFEDDISKYSVLHLGLGIYYLIPIEKTNVYFGPRIAIIDIKNPSEDRPPHIITSKTDWIFGATMGAEYKILKNLSVGFEIQYNYYEINPWTDFGYEERTVQRALETVFVIAFHL